MEMKIKDISYHKINSVSIPVVKGKLIFIQNHPEEGYSDHIKAIIVSETEKINVGDPWINLKDATLGLHHSATGLDVSMIEAKNATHCKKVIVFSEHLSLEQLRKFKDGDVVLVECESYEEDDPSWYLPPTTYQRIKVNASSHVTLHVVDETIPTYTLNQVKELCRQAYVSGYENGYVKGDWFGKIDEFFEENLK